MIHPTPSVELYVPWNNTWVELPALPTFTDDDGTLYNMTDAHILSMPLNGLSTLYIVGGADWDHDRDVLTNTAAVWKLVYDAGHHGYYWYNDAHMTPDMGKCVGRC